MNSNTQTIPHNTMGYLKFAYFILQSNISLHDFFLDKSIQQIVHIVNDVVNNGNQHNDILCLLQHQHQNQHLVEPVNPDLDHPHNIDPINPEHHHSIEPVINPDNIVNQLVSLARNTPNAKKIRAKAIPKAVETNPTETPNIETSNIETPKVKKTRAKPTPKAIETQNTETPNIDPETNPETNTSETPKVKKTRAKPKTNPKAETNAETNADTNADTPKVKKTRAKPIVETPIVETAPIIETPIVETDVLTTIVETDALAEMNPQTNVETPKLKKIRAKPKETDPNLTPPNLKKPRVHKPLPIPDTLDA
jgi:hypothetical protein